MQILLNKTLNLYISSYQIKTKSIMWFEEYAVLKKKDAEANGRGSAIALSGLCTGELKISEVLEKKYSDPYI